jgi:hypothetical protein
VTGPWARWDDWPPPAHLALYSAVRAVPGGYRLSDAEVDGYARLIATGSELGRGQELPRFRGASPAATDRQLSRLHDLADALVQHIETMNGPALGALRAEGCNAIDFLTPLRDLQENARHAYSEGPAYEGSGGGGGRPRKIEAAGVTAVAANVFERISGQRPSFTSDPETGGVSGDWPRVLGLVFDALYLEASVAAQVRAAR